MAHGFRKKCASLENRGLCVPIISPEHNELSRRKAIEVFEAANLDSFVDFNFSTVPNDAVWIRENICPPNRGLDLFVSDLDCLAPFHVWQNMMTVCRPLYFFMGNSGHHDCEEYHPNKDFFYVEEEYLHNYGSFALAITPPLEYELVIDRNHSHIRGWSEIQSHSDRRFSLYRRLQS